MLELLAQAARATSSAELSAHLRYLAAAAADTAQALVLTQGLTWEEAEQMACRHPLVASGLDKARRVVAQEAPDELVGRRAS